MIAVLACSAVTALVGYTAGVFAERCKRADAVLEALQHADRWRRIAQARPTFSTGPGSPWQPVDLEVERAPW